MEGDHPYDGLKCVGGDSEKQDSDAGHKFCKKETIAMQLDYPMKRNGMYIIKKKDFDDIGENVLKEYMPYALEYPQSVDILRFATDCLYLDVKNAYITPDGSVLGMITFGDAEFSGYGFDYGREKMELPEGTVVIDLSLWGSENKGRRRFTLAHECSHWICHRTYHSPDNRAYEFRRNGPGSLIACRSENIERTGTPGSFRDFDENDWEEWQADSLGAAILMLRKTFVEGFLDAMRCEGVRQNYLIKGDDRRIEASVIHRLMEVENAGTYA